MTDYDSSGDTMAHIQKVSHNLGNVISRLMQRAIAHDASKLEDIEKPVFDKFTPLLKAVTYGSHEYKEYLRSMGDALDHHYAVNSHHPEHFKNGIDGMSLLDLIEMLADWKAASERHADGDFKKSLLINTDRFNISGQLSQILMNTAIEMGWIEQEDNHE